MIGLIDYDAGNIRSVEKALRHLGQKVVLTRDPQVLLKADKVILPGVGSFGHAMENLNRYGLVPVIRRITEQGTPFLGICLGLQLLFERSEESPGVDGLGILKGEILRFPSSEGLKIPHMGWNTLAFPRPGRLFEGIREESCVYFVHSYYCSLEDPSQCAAQAEYGLAFDAAARWRNVFATQFHPEKSGAVGLRTLQNFLDIVENQ